MEHTGTAPNADLENFRRFLAQERNNSRQFPGITDEIMRTNAYLTMNQQNQNARIRARAMELVAQNPGAARHVITGAELGDPTLDHAEIVRRMVGEKPEYDMTAAYNQKFNLPEIYKTAGINNALAKLGLSKSADWKAHAGQAALGAALGAGTGALTAGEGNRMTGALTGGLAGGVASGIGHYAAGGGAPSMAKTLAIPGVGALAGAGQGAYINYRGSLSPEERARLDQNAEAVNNAILFM